MIMAASKPGSPERRELGGLLETAMDRIAADETLPLADRVDSLSPVLDLFHREHGDKAKPPRALAKKATRAGGAGRPARRRPLSSARQ